MSTNSASKSGSFASLQPVLELPTFDGGISWEAYLYQLDAMVAAKGWSEGYKAAALLLRPLGAVAGLLPTLPKEPYGDCLFLGSLLNDRFGDERLRRVFYSELQRRHQRPQDTYEELATSIDCLARKSFSGVGMTVPTVVATASFVDAIGDQDVQELVLLGLPKTLWDIMAQAMEI